MRIESHWQRHTLWPLLPFSALFALLSGVRRFGFRLGWLKSTRLPVPVIVVGNITAGGAGKTPATLWLAAILKARGCRPGIISRGYGGSEAGPIAVPTHADPARFGDEPSLIAARSICPIWIGRRRADAGHALLAAHPDVNVLICDDGLQHYALDRDIEVLVIDGQRGFGNGWRLPAGPLRESVSRGARCDVWIVNGSDQTGLPAHPYTYSMHLAPQHVYRLGQPDDSRPLSEFAGQQVHAVAGIGHPPRFFTTLVHAGLSVIEHPFPDHHAYTPQDIAALTDAPVLVTEKDAVKLAGLNLPAGVRIWVVPVDAHIDPALADLIDHRLR
ncbi:tetraacyldisaccharide 4'-kinase [Burkholderiaceae bacterium DAT-1]|nr:tetraacyldisaccharide 4'-kinase [Burkholderiaceae bacterium DAT-1]